jgi:hypothetical protein
MHHATDSSARLALQDTHIELTRQVGRSGETEVLSTAELPFEATRDQSSCDVGFAFHEAGLADLQNLFRVDATHEGPVHPNATLKREIAFVAGIGSK